MGAPVSSVGMNPKAIRVPSWEMSACTSCPASCAPIRWSPLPSAWTTKTPSSVLSHFVHDSYTIQGLPEMNGLPLTMAHGDGDDDTVRVTEGTRADGEDSAESVARDGEADDVAELHPVRNASITAPRNVARRQTNDLVAGLGVSPWIERPVMGCLLVGVSDPGGPMPLTELGGQARRPRQAGCRS